MKELEDLIDKINTDNTSVVILKKDSKDGKKCKEDKK